MENNFNIAKLVSNNACFDLQFRKDTRHERTGSPTYYRWKTQFVITAQKENIKLLKKVRKTIGCGRITINKGQARLSVQNINDIVDFVVPFFTKNKLLGNKKKDFELWQKAVNIIQQNKGKQITKWKKNNLLSLLQIHQSASKYKNKPKKAKWISMAKSMTKTL